MLPQHVINLIAPHLLRQDFSGDKMNMEVDESEDAKGEDFPTTSIDPSIFRTRRSTRKTEETM